MSVSEKKQNGRRKGAWNSENLLTEQSPFAVREAYKALRTNVIFSLPGTESKCIGVTSAVRGDGKSINAVNLAIAFAQIGKRVILVDCDMRLPTVSLKLDIQGTPGLSDFLVGEAKVEGVVRSANHLGISVLPAGNIPPDPTGLLESKQIGYLFSALGKIYDYVIVDLPPVTTVPDAAILSKYLNGYLLVVRHEKTEHRAVAEMLNQLHFANANILGFIYNDITADGKKYYLQHCGYEEERYTTV